MTDATVTIRPYAAEDSAPVATLLNRHGWAGRYVAGQLSAASTLDDDPFGQVLVADDDGCVVGFSSLQFHEWNGMAQLHGLAVHADRLRRGIAAALLAESERFARRLGARGVRVDTPADNQRARRFYQTNGYVEDYVMTRYYADDLDGIALVKFFDG